MTKEEIEEVKKYKGYPEGSGMKRHYDSVFLPFSEYLIKYYLNFDSSTWDIWKKKYLEPAFNKDRHEEMIKNFGYLSMDKHNFDLQYKVYKQLDVDKRLDNDAKKFIGFLAGASFFKKYEITVKEWFDMKNWSHPEHKEGGKTINEILNYPHGINMVKSSLPQMPYWKR